MEPNIKEYTQDEFNQLIESRNYEVFSAENVTAFCKDVLEKSQKEEIDEFEKSCAIADFISLTPAIVVGQDLIKRTFYYRESQTEAIEIPEGIFKSIDDKMCHKYKKTELNIFKGIAGINCADEDEIEKAKALPIGTEKTYGGKLYVKTERGWRPKAKGTRGASKEEKNEILDSKTSQQSNSYKNARKELADARTAFSKKEIEILKKTKDGQKPTEEKDKQEHEELRKNLFEKREAVANSRKKALKKISFNNASEAIEDALSGEHSLSNFKYNQASNGKYYVRLKKGIERTNPEAYNWHGFNWLGMKDFADEMKARGYNARPDYMYEWVIVTPKQNKFAKEVEEARKIGEQLQKEHEQRIASGQKIGSDDPRDHSKLIKLEDLVKKQ